MVPIPPIKGTRFHSIKQWTLAPFKGYHERPLVLLISLNLLNTFSPVNPAVLSRLAMGPVIHPKNAKGPNLEDYPVDGK